VEIPPGAPIFFDGIYWTLAARLRPSAEAWIVGRDDGRSRYVDWSRCELDLSKPDAPRFDGVDDVLAKLLADAASLPRPFGGVSWGVQAVTSGKLLWIHNGVMTFQVYVLDQHEPTFEPRQILAHVAEIMLGSASTPSKSSKLDNGDLT
jgi:hypothetical protein